MGVSPPVFNQLNLVVRDMDATLVFYRRLGLAIADTAVWRTASGGHHAEVTMPSGLSLEFDSAAMAQVYNPGWHAPRGNETRAVLGFALPSRDAVDTRYAELTAAGYTGRRAPHDAFWGARYAIVEDPDGNHVGLMSPVDPARKTAPPAL